MSGTAKTDGRARTHVGGINRAHRQHVAHGGHGSPIPGLQMMTTAGDDYNPTISSAATM